jgi:hypothetical protein
MKIVILTTFYQAYVNDFYLQHPELAKKSFKEQKAMFDYDAFSLAKKWSLILPDLGYETLDINMNIEPMQRAWAKENLLANNQPHDLSDIVLAQLKQFKPDVLWFDDRDQDLIIRIKREIPSIRLVLGWCGSAIINTNIWRHIDIILSCAPESVEYFQKHGLNAMHLNHAFDFHINERLVSGNKKLPFCFSGQLIRSSEFHLIREKLLVQLAEQIGITIYSPSYDFNKKDNAKFVLRAASYDFLNILKKLGIEESTLSKFPGLINIAQMKARPLKPVNTTLKSFLKPAVYGLKMFQTLHDSKITLNIHADSSPLYASNMRLFEITGTGSCMLTDWKKNVSDLFKPDEEIVVYKSNEECIEKAKWLINNPKECEKIAEAGKKRTLKEHTFVNRAIQLNDIIRNNM